jgi:hypothetical protein
MGAGRGSEGGGGGSAPLLKFPFSSGGLEDF